jgi:hypothetical protein
MIEDINFSLKWFNFLKLEIGFIKGIRMNIVWLYDVEDIRLENEEQPAA